MCALYVGYSNATGRCSGGPTKGARNMTAWYLGAYRSHGAQNDGIYNCRSIRGSSSPSVHGEGRACDLGFPGRGGSWCQTLANSLVAHSRELGVQCVIYNRRIWSGEQPYAGWRAYHGSDPHTEHIHVELSRASAKVLTVAHIQSVMGSKPAARPKVKAKAKAKPVLTRLLVRGSTGSAVKTLQRALGFKGRNVDGIFGPKTEAAVKAFQKRHHLSADGKVGPLTARALGWNWKG